MRVITGKYKGRHFNVPRTFKARPTTDFAKENLFNVLRAYVDFEETTALDLFAGTGSITLELLSRGCPRVVAVELDNAHHAFIASTIRQLGDRAATVLRADALRFISCWHAGTLAPPTAAANASTSSLPTRPMPWPNCPGCPTA